MSFANGWNNQSIPRPMDNGMIIDAKSAPKKIRHLEKIDFVNQATKSRIVQSNNKLSNQIKS